MPKITKLEQVPTIYIGIDPGKNGYISYCDNENTIVNIPIPLIKKEYDIVKMSQQINDISKLGYCWCVLEDVHAIFSARASSTFSFGRGLGIIEGLLTAAKIPVLKVQPKKWQKKLFEGIPEIRKPDKSDGKRGNIDTKPMALQAIRRLYPYINVDRKKQRKKGETQEQFDRRESYYDGLVDALCLMHYCRFHFNQK